MRLTSLATAALLASRTPSPRLCATELPIDIASAGSKGMGAFARVAASAGTFVCEYRGELLTEADVQERYADEEPLYLFTVNPDQEPKYIDAVDSTHVSHFFNHAQHPNTKHVKDKEARRIDFYLTRDVAARGAGSRRRAAGYQPACPVTPLHAAAEKADVVMAAGRPAANVPLTPDAPPPPSRSNRLFDDQGARGAARPFLLLRRWSVAWPHGVGADAPQQLVEAESRSSSATTPPPGASPGWSPDGRRRSDRSGFTPPTLGTF